MYSVPSWVFLHKLTNPTREMPSRLRLLYRCYLLPKLRQRSVLHLGRSHNSLLAWIFLRFYPSTKNSKTLPCWLLLWRFIWDSLPSWDVVNSRCWNLYLCLAWTILGSCSSLSWNLPLRLFPAFGQTYYCGFCCLFLMLNRLCMPLKLFTSKRVPSWLVRPRYRHDSLPYMSQGL